MEFMELEDLFSVFWSSSLWRKESKNKDGNEAIAWEGGMMEGEGTKTELGGLR